MSAVPKGTPDVAEVDAILRRAAERAGALRLAYAGAVTPEEAWRLHASGAARIVDVRTRPEWEFVGRVPDVPLVEWRRYGEQQPKYDNTREETRRLNRRAALVVKVQ